MFSRASMHARCKVQTACENFQRRKPTTARSQNVRTSPRPSCTANHTNRTVPDELRHPNPMIQSHLNALEAVMKRAALVEAAYETDVLFAAYRQQAAAFNRDVSQKVRFLEGCGVSD